MCPLPSNTQDHKREEYKIETARNVARKSYRESIRMSRGEVRANILISWRIRSIGGRLQNRVSSRLELPTHLPGPVSVARKNRKEDIVDSAKAA